MRPRFAICAIAFFARKRHDTFKTRTGHLKKRPVHIPARRDPSHGGLFMYLPQSSPRVRAVETGCSSWQFVEIARVARVLHWRSRRSHPRRMREIKELG